MNKKAKQLLGSALAVLVLVVFSLFGGSEPADSTTGSLGTAQSYSQSITTQQ